MDNENAFVEFLIRAKKHTYAGDGGLSAPSRPGSKDLIFEQDDYLYIDTYLGSMDFIGEEVVWHKQNPIWGMNYYGFMLIDDVPEGFSHCLKAALQNIPPEAPYRGPAHFEDGPFEYRCAWEGGLEQFSGTEAILMNDKAIYRLTFHGGRVR
jgi:hypothetical protein